MIGMHRWANIILLIGFTLAQCSEATILAQHWPNVGPILLPSKRTDQGPMWGQPTRLRWPMIGMHGWANIILLIGFTLAYKGKLEPETSKIGNDGQSIIAKSAK